MNRISNCPYTVFCGSILEEHRNKMQQNEDKLIGIVKKNQGFQKIFLYIITIYL